MKSYADEHIAYTFRKLMKKVPVDAIKVADIVDAGEINRKTFYYHFHGMEDLILWMVSKPFDRLDLRNSTAANWKSKVLLVANAIEEDKEFFVAVFQSKYEAAIFQQMKISSHRYIAEFIENCRQLESDRLGRAIELSDQTTQYIVDYYNNGVLSLIENWIQTGCAETSQGFVDVMDNLTKNTIFNVLEAFDGEDEG